MGDTHLGNSYQKRFVYACWFGRPTVCRSWSRFRFSGRSLYVSHTSCSKLRSNLCRNCRLLLMDCIFLSSENLRFPHHTGTRFWPVCILFRTGSHIPGLLSDPLSRVIWCSLYCQLLRSPCQRCHSSGGLGKLIWRLMNLNCKERLTKRWLTGIWATRGCGDY